MQRDCAAGSVFTKLYFNDEGVTDNLSRGRHFEHSNEN